MIAATFCIMFIFLGIKLAADRLFKELCKPEIMKIGWHLAQGDSRDDFVCDPVGHADFAAGLTDRLRYLIEQVKHGRYRPLHLVEIDVPKSGLSVRPGNVLPIEESSLLHAIVYLFAPLLDKHLDDAVYSYRLHKDWKRKAKKGEAMFREVEIDLPFLRKPTLRSISVFEAWYERWPAFEEDAKKAVAKEGYKYLTKTDISSYFENIDIRLLHDQVRSLLKRQEEQTLQLLFRVLEGWTRSTPTGMPIGRGIPQGNDVSSFLGNIYLVPLDRALRRFCSKHDAKWFRYVDDVKVFTKNEDDARSVVFEINQALRSLHLNLQGSKTEILSGVKLTKELDSSEFDAVGKAFDAIKKIDKSKPESATAITTALKPMSEKCKDFTRGLPDSVRGLKGKPNRMFRQLLTVYGVAGRSRKNLPEAAMHAVRELPDLRVLRSSLRYLSRLDYSTHDRWVDELLEMLEAEELLFPYQTSAVLETLMHLHPENPEKVGSRIRSYAFGTSLNKKHDWIVHMKGLESLATYPYRPRHFLRVIEKYVDHPHPFVRRAAVACLPRCPKDKVRKALPALIRHPDASIGRLATYLDRLVTDTVYIRQEIARIRASRLNDQSLTRRATALFAISCTENPGVATEISKLIDDLPETESAKLQWLLKSVGERVAWSP